MSDFTAVLKSLLVSMIVISTSVLLPSPTPVNAATEAYTFPTFNSGTITGTDPEVFVPTNLNVASVPAGEYLSFVVKADFVGGAIPAWSNTIGMQITNGGSVTYYSPMRALRGSLQSDANTTLYWSGVLYGTYTAGDPLTIAFADDYDDEFGTYTSELQNVTFTLYPAVGDGTNAVVLNTPKASSSMAPFGLVPVGLGLMMLLSLVGKRKRL